MSNKLNVYFPINNLNPQGWISEFITPVISKTGENRSTLAHLFYNTYFDLSSASQADLYKKLKIIFKTDQDILEYIDLRTLNSIQNEKKFIFLNGNHLDLLEMDDTLKGIQTEERDYQKYLLFINRAKPYELAFLQNYIKLSYGYRKTKNEEFTWVDFPFTQNYDLDFILREKTHARAEGSGLTSVNVNNQFNLATQVNSEISLDFIFGSMKILTQEINADGTPLRGTTSPFPYGFSFMKLVANLDFTKEAIKLEYGKKVAPGFVKEVPNGQELKSIIEKREKKVFLLTKFKHGFRFDKNGVVSIDVNYYNFHDTSMYSSNDITIPAYTPENIQKLKLKVDYGNLLEGYNKLLKQQKELEEKLKDAKKTSEAKEVTKLNSDQKEATIKDITDKLRRTNKTINSLRKSLKTNLTTSILDAIKAQGQLFAVSFNTIKKDKTFDVRTTISLVSPKNGDFLPIVDDISSTYDVSKFKENSKIKEFYDTNKSKADDLFTKIFARIFNSPYDDKEKISVYGNIMFFPLRALLSAGYSMLSKEKDASGESEQDQIPNMIFGNVLMKVGDRFCSINIGDLLVETGVFQKWYYNKIYKKDRLEYSFGAFVAEIMLDLVPEVLYRNRVGFDDKAPTTAVRRTEYYLTRPVPLQLKNKLYLNGDEADLKELSKHISKNPTNKPQPLLYFGQVANKTTTIPSPLFSKYGNSKFDFNELNDASKGILHVKIGADGGIVENVNFSAQDFSRIRSALAFESLANNQSRYFFFYYKLNMEMLGNNAFSYDSVVCVPSNPLGIDSEINDPGIAGYYKVTKSRDILDVYGNWRTNVDADWFYNPKNETREKNKSDINPVSFVPTITDELPASVNDPINYFVELLENDALSVINAQAQNVNKPDKKDKEKAKKDKQKPEKPTNKLDKEEKMSNKTPVSNRTQ